MGTKVIVDDQGIVIGVETVPDEPPPPSQLAGALRRQPARRQTKKAPRPVAYFGSLTSSGMPALRESPGLPAALPQGHVTCPGCGKSVPLGMLKSHRRSDCRAARTPVKAPPPPAVQIVCPLCQERLTLATVRQHMTLAHPQPPKPLRPDARAAQPSPQALCPVCRVKIGAGKKRLSRHLKRAHAELVITVGTDGLARRGGAAPQRQAVAPAPQRPSLVAPSSAYDRQVEERPPHDPLDATRDFAQFREHGRFGSASSYDDHEDEATP